MLELSITKELEHNDYIALAFQIKSVDTLGAGDVFHGLFALGLAEGFPEETSLINASAAAALNCSRTGGRDAIPLKHEIKAFLEERL